MRYSKLDLPNCLEFVFEIKYSSSFYVGTIVASIIAIFLIMHEQNFRKLCTV
jgi:NhaP-type Na+/H+ and K+/H+ antiporter